jgi:hypothetical protein
MSLIYQRFYLITHICIGILIIGFEYLYRWIIQTYRIYIRRCPDAFYIEFKQLNNIQRLNWFENKINNLVEIVYSMNDQCITKELIFNFNTIFLFLRCLWLTISIVYLCFALKRALEMKKSFI